MEDLAKACKDKARRAKKSLRGTENLPENERFFREH